MTHCFGGQVVVVVVGGGAKVVGGALDAVVVRGCWCVVNIVEVCGLVSETVVVVGWIVESKKVVSVKKSSIFRY